MMPTSDGPVDRRAEDRNVFVEAEPSAVDPASVSRDSRWSTILLARILEYLIGHEACQSQVRLLRVGLAGDDLDLVFDCIWLSGEFGIRVSRDMILPPADFTSSGDGDLTVGESNLEDVAFDVAVLWMCRPFDLDEVSHIDANGVHWLGLP